METDTQKGAEGFEVVRGRTTITVPHLNGKLTLVHPSEGPNDYAHLGSNLTSQGLYRPTMAQTASLAYSAWQNPKGELEGEVISKLKNNYFYAFNRLLWGKDRVSIADDIEKELLDASGLSNLEKTLARRFKAGDPKIRVVEYGFESGEQKALELSKNKFIIALAGKEGAEKLAEVADKYSKKPYVYVPDKSDFPTARVAGLGSLWYLDSWLYVDGSRIGYGRDGFASGVLNETAEGSSRKK